MHMHAWDDAALENPGIGFLSCYDNVADAIAENEEDTEILELVVIDE